jgi:hypothetical protein
MNNEVFLATSLGQRHRPQAIAVGKSSMCSWVKSVEHQWASREITGEEGNVASQLFHHGHLISCRAWLFPAASHIH